MSDLFGLVVALVAVGLVIQMTFAIIMAFAATGVVIGSVFKSAWDDWRFRVWFRKDRERKARAQGE